MNILKSRVLRTLSLLLFLAANQGAQAQLTLTYSNGNNGLGAISTNPPNNPTILTISSGTATQSGVISGAGELVKAGSGTIILNANETLTGTTTVGMGTLTIGNGTDSASIGSGNTSTAAVTVNSGATLEVSSQATVTGATVPGEAQSGTAAPGGTAVQVNAGTLDNAGTITGGAGQDASLNISEGGNGGTGVIITNGIGFANTGTITGGNGGAGGDAAGGPSGGTGGTGMVISSTVSVENEGNISGGTGGVSDGLIASSTGGVGLVLNLASGQTLTNSNGAQITGGAGGSALSGSGNGGVGLIINSGTFVSMGGGTIAGGSGVAGSGAEFDSQYVQGDVGTGGTGVVLNGGTFIDESNLHIDGGAKGGTAMEVNEAGNITIRGTLTGGNGYPNYNGQNGGTGLLITAAATVTVDGTISGGAAGAATGVVVLTQPTNGVGVVTKGAAVTLNNEGTINGGVSMDNYANIVTLFDGSVINGNLNMGTNAGSTLTFSGSGDLVLSDLVTGSVTCGTFLKQGSGTWTIDRTVSNQAVTISAGTLVIGTSTSAGSIGGKVSDSGVLEFKNVAGSVFSGAISGSGSVLVSTGTATLIFTGANTYSGGTTISAGTLQIGNGGTTGSLPSFGSIMDNANLAFDHSDTVTVGYIQGTGSVTQLGTGTLILSSNNAYTGGTIISAGTLQVGAGTSTGSIAGNITDNGVLVFDTYSNLTPTGTINGSGSVVKESTNTLSITNTETYSGGTTLAGGTLQIGNGTAAGSLASTVTYNSGTLLVTATGTITGNAGQAEIVGSYSQNATPGSAGVVVTTNQAFTNQGKITGGNGGEELGAAGYESGGNGISFLSGGTLINDATGKISGGNGGGEEAPNGAEGVSFTGGAGNLTNKGSISNGVVMGNYANTVTLFTGSTITGGLNMSSNTGAVLILDGAGSQSYSSAVGGTTTFAGDLIKQGIGTWTIDQNFASTGTTGVRAGTLVVNSSMGTSALNVSDGATLTGSGSIAGIVTVQNGGTLTPNAASTLTVGGLVLNSGSQLDFQLNNPGIVGGGVNDLIAITNNLTLGGVLNLTTLSHFGVGTYTLFTYGGTLTDDGLNFGVTPGGYDLTVGTGTNGVVTLEVAAGAQYWNGSNTSSDGTVQGGNGTWDSSTTNWTDTAANSSSSWTGNTAVFGGMAGTVTVSGTQNILGLQFTTDGYEITGGTLNVGVTGAELRIDPDLTATIDSTLIGTGGITKTGEGTIILSGTNTYQGGTTINAGTLQISADANLGKSTGGLTINDGTLATTADITSSRTITLGGSAIFDIADSTTFTADGTVSGVSNFDKEGGGDFVFDTAPNYTGGTTINDGTLDTASHDLTTTFLAGTSGTLAMGSGSLTLDQDNDTTFSGVITGSGSITKNDEGSLVLDGVNSYTGNVTVNAGTLQAGVAGAFTETGYTVNGGTLDLNGYDLTVSELSGTGGTINLGTATLTIDQTANTTYAGDIEGVFTSISGPNGGLNVTGSGQLQLTGQNDIGGPVNITGGSVDIASGASVNSEYILLDYGAALTVEGTVTESNDFNVGYYGSATATIQDGGSVSDLDSILGQNPGQTAQVTVDGAGSSWVNNGDLIIGSNATGEVDITNDGFVSAAVTELATSYFTTGTLNISSGGVLETGQITKGTDLGATASITLNGGTLRATQTQNDYLSNFAPGDITLASGGGTIDTNGNDIGIQSSIGGYGSLTKIGAGTLNLSAENTYSGATIIAGGVLQLGAAGAIASDSAIELSGGTFDLNGFSPAAFTTALAVDADSTIDFGLGHIGGVTLQFADSSGVTWTSDLDLVDFTVGTDELGFGSDASGLTSGQLADIDLAGYEAIGLDSSGLVEFQAEVPEPTAAWVLPIVLGFFAFSFWRRCPR